MNRDEITCDAVSSHITNMLNGVLEEEEKIFREVVAPNFQSMMKNINSWVQETQRLPVT